MGRAGSLFELRVSRIDGQGLFARRRISAGTRILEFAGRRITLEEAEQRRQPGRRVVLLKVARGLFIDPEQEGNEARYVNHSCEPNCEAIVEEERIFIEAIQDIPAGAELTFDYALDREGELPGNRRGHFTCRCGARTCRGSMLGPWARKKPRGGKRNR
jgi:uncharacterized protein